MKIDARRNEECRELPADVAAPDSQVRILAIATNEELAIARHTYRIVARNPDWYASAQSAGIMVQPSGLNSLIVINATTLRVTFTEAVVAAGMADFAVARMDSAQLPALLPVPITRPTGIKSWQALRRP